MTTTVKTDLVQLQKDISEIVGSDIGTIDEFNGFLEFTQDGTNWQLNEEQQCKDVWGTESEDDTPEFTPSGDKVHFIWIGDDMYYLYKV